MSPPSPGSSLIAPVEITTACIAAEITTACIAADIGGYGTRATFRLAGSRDFKAIILSGRGRLSDPKYTLPTLVACPRKRKAGTTYGDLLFGFQAKRQLNRAPDDYLCFRHIKDTIASAEAGDDDVGLSHLALLRERQDARSDGRDALAIATEFYKYVGKTLLAAAGGADAHIILSVPGRYNNKYATYYRNLVLDILDVVGGPNVTVRLLDEATAALIGALPGFPHRIPPGIYTVIDLGSTTTDITTIIVGRLDSRGIPTLEFQTSISHRYGTILIIDAVDAELKRLIPGPHERVTMQNDVDQHACDPIAFLQNESPPTSVSAAAWEASISNLKEKAAEVSDRICIYLMRYLTVLLHNAKFTGPPHTLFFTGGGSAMVSLQAAVQRVFQQDPFKHITFRNTSELPGSVLDPMLPDCVLDPMWNQCVLRGLQRVGANPELVTPTHATEDLYMTSTRPDVAWNTIREPTITCPFRVWQRDDDICGPDHPEAQTRQPYCPVLFDLTRQRRAKRKDKFFVFDTTIWRNKTPHESAPIRERTEEGIVLVSPDDVQKGAEYRCRLDIDPVFVTSWIYVWLQPQVLETRVVIIYRRDGAAVDELRLMSLKQVLGGRAFDSAINETLRVRHQLLYAEARQVSMPRATSSVRHPAPSPGVV